MMIAAEHLVSVSDQYTVLAAIVGIIPALLAYYGSKRASQKKMGVVSQKMTEGFSASPVKTLSSALEAQADEIRRLRKQQETDEKYWRGQQQQWFKVEADLRKQIEVQRVDKASLLIEIKQLKFRITELENRVMSD